MESLDERLERSDDQAMGFFGLLFNVAFLLALPVAAFVAFILCRFAYFMILGRLFCGSSWAFE
jgi:hypothetical protein